MFLPTLKVTAKEGRLTKLETDIEKYDWKIRFRVPQWAFVPDEWSRVFWNGLFSLAAGWKGKYIWEVGVGTGINIMMLRKRVEATWYFSDYDERCVPLALENMARSKAVYVLDSSIKYDHKPAWGGRPRNIMRTAEELNPFPQDLGSVHPLCGSWDLVSPPLGSSASAPRVDVIFGCLPQVPAHIDLSTGNRIAHYYDPGRYPKAHLNALGLGLVESLLVRARDVLNKNGTVVLNLAGRPSRKRLFSLFRETGYEPCVVHLDSVRQHPETSLASLAELEKNGHGDFEFFTEKGCRENIGAGEAESLRSKGKPVYHKIYVMAGTLT